VPSADAQRVQEVHLLLIHVLSELVEERLAAEGTAAAAPSDAVALPAYGGAA
jgi:hypothetical protein